MRIRAAAKRDFKGLFAINDASTPGVSEETPASLGTILSLGTVLIAESESGALLGFINLVEPGTATYESANLRWFERYGADQGLDLSYVDRIAIAEAARGQGVGEALYRAAFDLLAGRDAIGCEVNTAPPNPGSHRFHQRLGFREVGAQAFGPEKAVAYYLRTL